MRKLFKNRLGFSLVELITAFAVLGIATLAIGGFFVSSSRSYAGTSSETSIQYEAQMALNQIENKLIDATLGVNYALYDGANYTFVEKDVANESSLTAKYLYIFDSDGTNFDLLLIKWDKAAKELLYKEISLGTSFAEVKDIPVEATGTWDLMAEGVTTFSVDLSKYIETKTVDVTLGLEKRDKDFTTTGTITLRNNVLVNESDLKEIFDNLSNKKATRIDQVELRANTNVTVPGGQVQLSTTVKGVYPSQDIHGWYVAKTCADLANNIIGGEGNLVDNNSYVNSDKVLMVSDATGSTFHQTVYVQAYVETVDEAGQPKTVYSNIVVINVRDIEGLIVKPTADENLAGNSTLFRNGDPTGSWSSIHSSEAFDANKTVTIYPQNIIQMQSTIDGSVADTDTTKVLWSIDAKDTDVIASISENGVITVDKNSKAGFLNVKATLQGTTYSVVYPFMVGSPYNKDVDKVTVSGPERMDRGGAPYQCEVYLNGVKASETDYNWSVVVTNTAGQVVTGDPVTISSSGILTVKDTLAYDYDYRITVVATLKSNSLIQGTDIVPVPKVSLELTPATYRAYFGRTIPAGNIVCEVIGLANYDVNWTMAKETNPSYYFTAYGNTNITGTVVNGEKTATIVIGADEPSQLTYMRVKATLVGHTSISDTMRLNFTDDVISDEEENNNNNNNNNNDNNNENIPDDDEEDDDQNNEGTNKPTQTTYDYNVRTSDGSVERGGKEQIYLTSRYSWNSSSAIKADDWEIAYATDSQGNRVSTEGLSIEKVSGNNRDNLVVSADYQLANTRTITVYIRGYKDNKVVDDLGQVTIQPISLTIKQSNSSGGGMGGIGGIGGIGGGSSSSITIGRYDEKDFYYQVSGLTISSSSDVKAVWQLRDINDNPLNSTKIYLSGQNGNEVTVNTNGATSNQSFKLCIYLKNNAETVTYTSTSVTIRVSSNYWN